MGCAKLEVSLPREAGCLSCFVNFGSVGEFEEPSKCRRQKASAGINLKGWVEQRAGSCHQLQI